MDETRGEGQETENNEEVDELNSSSSSSPEVDDGEVPQLHLAIAELLEVALHTILYIRQVYPVELFERRIKFGIPVFQCIDSSINEYVSEAMQAVTQEIAENTIARIIINIHQSERLLEKFIFSFDIAKEADGEVPDADIMPLDVVQRQMRAMLVKLNAIDSQLLPFDADDDLSFSFIMQVRAEGTFRISEDDLKFDASVEDCKEKRRREHSLVRDPSLVHIVRTGSLSVSLHVQESEAKELLIASKIPKIDELKDDKNGSEADSPDDSP